MGLEDAIQRGAISDDDVTQEKLELFLSRAGRKFYKLPGPAEGRKIVLVRKGEKIPTSIKSEDGKAEVGISRGGDATWSLRWVD
jgi:dihydroorotase